MTKKILLGILGCLIGAILGYLVVFYTPFFGLENSTSPIIKTLQIFGPKVQTIGFLPYWLLDKADGDYSKYFTNITYFGLVIGSDGNILTRTSPQETEPGWLALNSGKIDPFLKTAADHNQSLSLLVFNGDEDSIASLISDPIPHAKNLVSDIGPIMKKYNFKDLNLDVESSKVASDEARANFSKFFAELKKGLVANQLGTLTVDISPTAFIKNYLLNPSEITPIADHIVIMTYDYHYAGSLVTGPISPLMGAGTQSEFDVQKAIEVALNTVPSQKIILGFPVYGYEWETINDATRSATIPATGVIASDMRVQSLLSDCATCSAVFDPVDQEPHIIYKDLDTNSYHQIFYTDKQSLTEKLNFASQEKLGGVAVWALGYESSDVLAPLESFK